MVANLVLTSPAPYGYVFKANGTADLIGTIYADTVDLTGTVDRLETAGGAAPGRERALVGLVADLEAAYGRSADYEPAVPVGRVGAPTVAAAAVGAGLLLVVVVSLWRGPVARSLPRGLLRVGALLLLGTTVGGLVEVAVPHAGPRPSTESRSTTSTRRA